MEYHLFFLVVLLSWIRVFLYWICRLLILLPVFEPWLVLILCLSFLPLPFPVGVVVSLGLLPLAVSPVLTVRLIGFAWHWCIPFVQCSVFLVGIPGCPVLPLPSISPPVQMAYPLFFLVALLCWIRVFFCCLVLCCPLFLVGIAGHPACLVP